MSSARFDALDELRDHVLPDLRAVNAAPAGDVLGGESTLIGVMEALYAEIANPMARPVPDFDTLAMSIEDDEQHAVVLVGLSRSASGIEASALRLAAAAHDIRAAWRRGRSVDEEILNAFIMEVEGLTECLITQRAADRPGRADVLRAERSRKQAIAKLMTVRTEAAAAQRTASAVKGGRDMLNRSKKEKSEETRRRIHELMPAARHKARLAEGDWVEELQHAWKMLHLDWGPPPSKATIHRLK